MDLPTPDCPSSTTVDPGARRARSDVEALAGHGGHDDDVDSGRRTRDVAGHEIGVGGQVGLGEDDQGRGAALPGEGDQAFEPAEVGGQRQGHDHSHDVDVGRQQLLAGPAGGLGAPDGRTPGQQADARPVGRVANRQPVSGGRVAGPRGADDLLAGRSRG